MIHICIYIYIYSQIWYSWWYIHISSIYNWCSSIVIYNYSWVSEKECHLGWSWKIPSGVIKRGLRREIHERSAINAMNSVSSIAMFDFRRVTGSMEKKHRNLTQSHHQPQEMWAVAGGGEPRLGENKMIQDDGLCVLGFRLSKNGPKSSNVVKLIYKLWQNIMLKW